MGTDALCCHMGPVVIKTHFGVPVNLPVIYFSGNMGSKLLQIKKRIEMCYLRGPIPHKECNFRYCKHTLVKKNLFWILILSVVDRAICSKIRAMNTKLLALKSSSQMKTRSRVLEPNHS